MGKYMRKSKSSGVVTVLEVSQPLGVRTRAKTLALRRLQNSAPETASAVEPSASSGSYLQLRSRRLVKLPIHARGHHATRRHRYAGTPKPGCMRNPNPISSPVRGSGQNSRPSSVPSGSGGSVSFGDLNEVCAAGVTAQKQSAGEEESNNDAGIEASLGENILEFDGRDRGMRESTPCSLIRDPDTVRTPGSTTRPTSSNPRIGNPTPRIIPAAREMDEFFAGVEAKHRRLFIEKYNFDPVNDKPLPGRFKWEKMDQ